MLNSNVISTNTEKVTAPVPSKLPAHFVPLKVDAINGVEKFVLFIGYPRSGHSIIGSYMDAHPNMIIAHEYPLFQKLSTGRMFKREIFNFLYKSSYDEFVNGWRGQTNVKNKGYSLGIQGLWQATYDKLKVIGNKYGGTTVQFYRKHPEIFLSTMEYLKSTVGVPVLLIHVVRNPFDMIATQTLYVKTGIRGVRVNASETNKFNDINLLSTTATDMIGRMAAVEKLVGILKLPTLEIHHEDFISDPVRVMKSICEFVGVECPEYYLKKCKENTFSSSSKSRHHVVWSQSLIHSVQQRISHFSFLQRYSFD